MRIRVLHLLNALGHGGAEAWLLRLIEPLRALGVDIDFALRAPQLSPTLPVARDLGARVHEVRLGLAQTRYVRKVAQIVREERYDIVHTHEFLYSGLGVLAARRASAPTVMTLHHFTMDPQSKRAMMPGVRQARHAYARLSLGYALKRATAVTALSTAVMSRVLPGYATDPRCSILRLCVDLQERAAEPLRASLRDTFGWPSTTPVIIHAGRFVAQKNHAGVLRIFRQVLDELPEARLLLMGQGPLEPEIHEAAQDLTSRGIARFLGVRDDVASLFSASDVLLFPSLHEGFGLVALEANGCGLPVVGTRVPGLDEAIVDGETGILHSLVDEAGMAASVVSLIREPKRAAELASRGRHRAGALYSARASAELLATTYRTVRTLA